MPQPNPYVFTEPFQDTIVALLARDFSFWESTRGLIRPEYFTSQANAIVASLVLEYYERYHAAMSIAGMTQIIANAITQRRIRADYVQDITAQLQKLYTLDISGRQQVIDESVAFAKSRAWDNALLKAVDLKAKGEYDKIDDLFKEVQSIGASESKYYELFEEVDTRTQARQLALSSSAIPTGITTGCPELNNLLYHNGWGRKELSVFMAPLKGGKSTGLVYSAVSAALAGHNVLYVTLEVSREITTDRMDAFLSDAMMTELKMNAALVKQKIDLVKSTTQVGKICVEEFPSGTWSPGDAQRLIDHHRSRGRTFDLFIIDYLDIMRPNRWTDNDITNSKAIWIDSRAIAQKEGLAILSATQSTRGGATADVITADMASDDINKMRTADLVISICRTEQERKDGEARLFIAASRNSQDYISLRIAQDQSRMRFISKVLGII